MQAGAYFAGFERSRCASKIICEVEQRSEENCGDDGRAADLFYAGGSCVVRTRSGGGRALRELGDRSGVAVSIETDAIEHGETARSGGSAVQIWAGGRRGVFSAVRMGAEGCTGIFEDGGEIQSRAGRAFIALARTPRADDAVSVEGSRAVAETVAADGVVSVGLMQGANTRTRGWALRSHFCFWRA